LASPNNGDTMGTELESRLNELFGEDDTPDLSAPTASGQSKQTQDSPLAELKNQVLSIDWEITDEVLDSFVDQVETLKKRFPSDKIVLTFLQILGSLGSYIRAKRGKAHPKTFKTLNSVFARLEEVVDSRQMSEADKTRILQLEIKRYNELKTVIAQAKRSTATSRRAPSASPGPGVSGKAPAGQTEALAVSAQTETETSSDTESAGDRLTVDALSAAVTEIKQFIRSEISKLKNDLESLRRG